MYKDVGKRIMALLLSVCMIAGMVDLSGFTVRAEGNEKYYTITNAVVNSSVELKYTGASITLQTSDITVTATVEDGEGNSLPAEELSSEQYELVNYQNNTDAGQASVTVKGKGGVTGDFPLNFQIQPADISADATTSLSFGSSENVEVSDTGEYTVYVLDDRTITPSVEVRNARGNIVNAENYTVSYQNNSMSGSSGSVKTATVTIQGKKNYLESTQKVIEFKIEKMNPANLVLELVAETSGGEERVLRKGDGGTNTEMLPYIAYDGKEHKLEEKHVQVKYTNESGKEETLNWDQFELKYYYNGEETTNLKSAGKIEVAVRGTSGKYQGLMSEEKRAFFIRKTSSDKSLGVPDNEVVQFTVKDQIYPGSSGTLAIEKEANGDQEAGIDTEATITDPTGRKSFKNSDKFTVKVNDSWKTAKPDELGKIPAKATFTAKNGSGYNGNKTINFTITAPQLSNLKIAIKNPENVVYNGQDWLQKIIDEDLVVVADGEYTSNKSGKGDYIVTKTSSSQQAIGARTYTDSLTITPTADGQLSGDPVKISVTVNRKNINDSDINATLKSNNIIYDGRQKTVDLEVKYQNSSSNTDLTLVSTTDYTPDYSQTDNINAGTATVILKGNGNYTGERKVDFTIQQLEISEDFTSGAPGKLQVDSPIQDATVPYKGEPVAPTISIRVTRYQGDTTGHWMDEDDYDVTYENESNGTDHTNVSDGVITMTISGKGNYKGSLTRRFTITPVVLTDSSVRINPGIEAQTYTGEQITPFDPTKHSVVHINGSTLTENDYEMTYGDNNSVGQSAGIIYITGKKGGNYTGKATLYFRIKAFEVNSNSNLEVTVQGKTAAEQDRYDLINDPLEEIEYEYTGQAKTFNAETEEIRVKNGSHLMVYGTDYTIEYSKNVGIGTADITIIGNGTTYTGRRTLHFRIKGNLDNWDTKDNIGIEIGDQIFSNGIIVPSEDTVKVTFKMADEDEPRTLKMGKDFTIENDSDEDPTPVGTAARAKIQGIGDYYGTGYQYFNVIKLNLTEQEKNLTELKYIIAGIQEDAYPYSGLAIRPEPVITHNDGKPDLTKDQHYSLKYYKEKEGGEDEEVTNAGKDAFGIGSYDVEITGIGTNYEGSVKKSYSIRQYNIKTDGLEQGRIRIEGVADEVVLDDIKFSQDISGDNASKASLAMMGGSVETEGESDGGHIHGEGEEHSKDEVVWKNLKVMYKPVGIQNDTTNYPEEELEYGVDYTVEYANNKDLGDAVYTIKGIGNFTGEISQTFKIIGDLGGARTHIDAKPCYFTPSAATATEPANANKTEVTVTYTHKIDGEEVTRTFVEGTDYKLRFTDNTQATHPNPDKAEESALKPAENAGGKVIVEEIMKMEGDKELHTGLGSGSNADAPETFAIYQRDISEYGGDTGLEFTGLKEEGYEYTGEQIIPDFKLLYGAIELAGRKLKEGEDPEGEDYDYTVRTAYSTNVWEDSEPTTPEDDTKRVLPEYTVEARTDASGLYNGNYCGKITGEPGEFKINPRKLTQDTVDNRTPIINTRKEGIGDKKPLDADGWRWGYTRSAINFPKEGNFVLAPNQPTENGLEITWDNGSVQAVLKEGTDYTVKYENNTGIGEASIWIETPMKSNYEGPYEKHFSIVATIEEVDNDHKDDGLEPYMKLPWGNPEKVPYGIVPTYPDLQFEDYSRVLAGESREPYILEEGKDFKIITEQDPDPDQEKGHSQNNTNVTKEGEDAVVVIRGIGNYEGVVSRTYKIVPKDLSDKGIVVQFLNCADYKDIKNPYIFNGEAQEPKFEVYNNRAKDIESMENNSEVPGESEESPKPVYNPYQSNLRMILGTDYEIQSWENNVGPASEKGPSYLILQAKEGGNYTGTLRAEFNIVLRQMEGLTYTITEPENIIYNGAEQRPEVEVSYMDGTRKIVLDPENDYDVEYTNNVNVPVKTETPEEGEEQPLLPTITFTGKGGYDGTHTINFDIKPRDITGDEITATAVAMYNSGNAVTPIITVKDTGILTGVTLDPENDYEVVAGSQTGETGIAEEGTVDIAGKGNYTGTKKVTFRIIPPDGVLTIEEIPEQEFTNSPIMPKVQVSLVSPQIETPFPLNENDYDIRYTDNLKAGTAKVFVTGTGAFEDMGTIEKDFTIIPKSIGSEGTIDSAMTLSSIEPQWYGGRPIVPGVELKFQPSSQQAIREGEETNNPVTLIQGTDYRVTAVNNTMVGEATATITGIGNYTGTIETKFRIHGNMNMVDVAPIPTQDYTGSPVTPVPQVSIGGKAMVEGTDYRVEYSNNVDRGTATITITGTEDWYFGTKVVKFDIARELSSETAVRGVAAVYTYTGAAITPPVRVEDDGNLLVSGVDYDIAYSENVNAGTATITITGKGKYTGGTTASFKISPQQLGRARISPVSDQIYNGQEQNPPITVTAGNTTLENGKDYSVVYVNSAAPGMASVIVKGEGNYTGTQTVNYNIKVPEITGVKVSKYTNKSMTLSWNKNDVVSGYEIYNSKNRRAVRVNKPTTAKGTVSKLKAGTAQTFRVRAYVNKDGQYYYGPFTSVKGATAPNSTKISSLKSAKKKQVTVKWKKVKGATQYEVYRSTSKKGKYKKLATTKKTSYTDKKATGGKKYYYKIRVCKKIDKKNYYSSYSAVKSVKAKK